MHAEVGVDQGGFRQLLGTITLPAGTIAIDSGHHIIGANGPGGSVIWSTDTSPQLYGNGGATFSRAFGGWLPVQPELVSPDGLHYAYLHEDGTIRLADNTGHEVIVANPKKLQPIAYTGGGVVLATNGPAANGLWMLDVSSHAITALLAPSGNDDWLAVTGTTAWGRDSPLGLGYAAPTKLLRVALSPGSTPSVIVTAPAGDSIPVMEADATGGVVAVLSGSAPAVIYVDAAGSSHSLSGSAVGTLLSRGLPRQHADGHGVWFLTQSGIFLFTASGGLQAVGPALKGDVLPGGDCV